MSVCASVLAVAIALNWGISAAFWSGVACYAAAALAFVMASREAVVPARSPSAAQRAADGTRGAGEPRHLSVVEAGVLA